MQIESVYKPSYFQPRFRKTTLKNINRFEKPVSVSEEIILTVYDKHARVRHLENTPSKCIVYV